MKIYKKHISLIIRALVGVVFIISGAFKLASIPSFENLLLKLDIISWKYIFILSRVIIGFEFLLGILLISGIYIRRTLQTTLYTLIGFSFILVYLHFYVSTQDNCGCFGEIIELNPVESIIKNIFLIVLVITSLKIKDYREYKWFYKYRKYILSTIIIVSFAWPYIAYAPITKNVKSNYRLVEPFYIDKETMRNVKFNNKDSVDLTIGKQIICFSSLTCPSCKNAISKLSTVHKKNLDFSISIIFLEAEEKQELLAKVISETGLSTIPYTFFSVDDFFKSSDNRLPFVVFSEDGKATDLRNNDDLHLSLIFDFFKKDK